MGNFNKFSRYRKVLEIFTWGFSVQFLCLVYHNAVLTESPGADNPLPIGAMGNRECMLLTEFIPGLINPCGPSGARAKPGPAGSRGRRSIAASFK